ncbi:MAG: ECF transporter S component [Eubacteriales bacterium]|nr:ECF transporter S component [Eubacteriales bacterium]
MNIKSSTKRLVLTSLFAAIIVILNFTPIGYIQLPIVKATIIHVPVIIGSIILGPKIGAFLGFIFGLTSLYNNTFTPSALSFAFSPAIALPGTDRGSWAALLVAFIPRILVGITPYFTYKLFNKLLKDKYRIISLGIGGVIGSMTNTILVLNLIYFLFRDAYGTVNNLAAGTIYKAILAITFANGIPEAIVAAVISAIVCRALQKYLERTG